MPRAQLDPVRTEAGLLSHVRKAARFYHWRCYHTRFSLGSDPGFPDLILARGARLIAAELKGPKGKTREGQEEWLAAFRQSGAEVYLWTPNDLDQIHMVLR
jgi:hypothetical protein